MKQQTTGLLAQLERLKLEILSMGQQGGFDQPETFFNDVLLECWAKSRDLAIDWSVDQTQLILTLVQHCAFLRQLTKCKSKIMKIAKQRCGYHGNRYYQAEEDLCQDVSIRCWNNYSDGKIDWLREDHSSLIFRIALNLCHTARGESVRQQRRPLNFEPIDHIEDSQPHQIARTNERDLRVTKAISALSSTLLTVIQKRFFTGMKPQEIASESGDKITTVYKQLDRAKRAISQYCPDSEWLDVM